MIRIPARNVWTVVIALALTATVPVGIFTTFRALMSRFITKDNAGIVFDQFQSAIEHGSIVRDSIAASDVAATAYWKKTQALPLDGWGHQLRISATVLGNNCQMTILSAGGDGAFGTADDIAIQRGFDVTIRKSKPDITAGE